MEFEALQRKFCRERGADFVPATPETKSGFALNTKGLTPLNGLRHPPGNETSGWYIWCGEKFSESADFFVPIHTKHIYEDYPRLTEILGLAPGYRFLVDGEYLDVWFDASLLYV